MNKNSINSGRPWNTQMQDRLYELIKEMQQKLKVTSIVVTHDMETACYVADRIAMIYEGDLIAVDTVDNFRRINDSRVKAFLRGLYLGG